MYKSHSKPIKVKLVLVLIKLKLIQPVKKDPTLSAKNTNPKNIRKTINGALSIFSKAFFHIFSYFLIEILWKIVRLLAMLPSINPQTKIFVHHEFLSESAL